MKKDLNQLTLDYFDNNSNSPQIFFDNSFKSSYSKDFNSISKYYFTTSSAKSSQNISNKKNDISKFIDNSCEKSSFSVAAEQSKNFQHTSSKKMTSTHKFEDKSKNLAAGQSFLHQKQMTQKPNTILPNTINDDFESDSEYVFLGHEDYQTCLNNDASSTIIFFMMDEYIDSLAKPNEPYQKNLPVKNEETNSNLLGKKQYSVLNVDTLDEIERMANTRRAAKKMLDAVKVGEYKCKYCDETFTKGCALGGHMSKKHNKKSFENYKAHIVQFFYENLKKPYLLSLTFYEFDQNHYKFCSQQLSKLYQIAFCKNILVYQMYSQKTHTLYYTKIN